MLHSFSDKLRNKLGLGTWQFGGANYVNGVPTGWGDFERIDALEIVAKALESGIRFFDTSDAYGRGLSETILGEAISASSVNREDLILCTKFGHREIFPDKFVQDFSKEWLKQAVLNSCNRLNSEYIDVLLLHSPPDNFDWLNLNIEPFEELVNLGLIKQYGVSSRSVYGAKKVFESGFGSCVEVIYNILDRRAEEVLFGSSEIYDYDIISRVPLASGFLTPKRLLFNSDFEDDNYRSRMASRDLDWLSENSRKLQFLNEKPGGISANAIKFCLQNEHISTVIPGARSVGQLKNNLESLVLADLNSSDFERISELVPDVPNWWKQKP